MKTREFLLDAFASYIRQTTIATKDAVLQAFNENSSVADLFIEYFKTKFDPKLENRDVDAVVAKIDQILPNNIALKAVYSFLKATVRTNYFQGDKDYVSFKIKSGEIHHLPKPRPMAEIFVYSKDMDGVHLRFGKIARGGIRWSDRKDDFRTEILGLVKAQQVKNVVIVPVGSKGGFYPKNAPVNGTREEIRDNAIECYKTLIRGMLDLTDNFVKGKIVNPENTVRYDENDPYLVVAADKGTASFSDIANAISLEYNFWLGDAFASGGSAGFSHKGMAITARGAWRSVARHFKECGKSVDEEFTCVGVGDMSGDVYGNAMLLSKSMKLVGAFNGTQIFVDPNPDPKVSFEERQRLFKAEKQWDCYDTSKLSKGGAVYSRKDEVLKLSPEAMQCFGLTKSEVTPNELIHAILTAQVDLIFFGGIGTYIKASDENPMDVKDAANAAIRINGTDVRAKIIGEGANLGMTQRGRVECGLLGIKLNTDAVDNSAGVDCSDHEVNLKIMLNEAVQAGKITNEQRNQILSGLKDEIAELVLSDNFYQTQVISYMYHRGAKSIPGNKKLMNVLEKEEKLDRALEFLPTDAEMDKRFTKGIGLTRSELCVLMAYSKLTLFDHLLNSDLFDDTSLEEQLISYFPKSMVKDWKKEMLAHRLRREIIGTVVVNNFVNRVGVNFISSVRKDIEAPVVDIVKAYLVVKKAYDTETVYRAIETKNVDEATRMDLYRKVIVELENMTATVLRTGLDGSIDEEAKKLATKPNEKFEALKA
ncbi:MAG: NAD-glutamate dehydrogenase [Alphaproteobacteria bacterium]|nr:NAD-glutamate dehydrogenase [Alphaproteobacteria bacterium]